MADSKITALAALTTADPANDMFPVVDVSDTSMAASGTTKRISINNILACSPSATLASATITGDLTVDTSTLKVDSANNRVGIGTAIPAVGFDVGYTESVFGSSTSSGYSILNLIGTGTGSARYGSIRKNYDSPFDLRIRASNSNSDAPIIFELSNASTAMTLNSTGLGVGGSVLAKISAYLTSTATYNSAAAGDETDFQISRVNNSTVSGQSSTIALNSSSDNGANVARVYLACVQESNASYASSFTVKTRNSAGTNAERFRIDSSGNVGIGVASPSNRLETQESGTGSGLGGIVSSTATVGGNAGYVFRTGGTNRWSLSLTGSAGAESIRFYDVNNSATRLLIDTSGNVISNVTGTAPALATNSQMVFNLTSNTNLRISVRGTDGTTRTANITLA